MIIITINERVRAYMLLQSVSEAELYRSRPTEKIILLLVGEPYQIRYILFY